MNLQELQTFAEEHGLVWTDRAAFLLPRYAELLKEWNEKMNLTAITEPEEVYEKHFADCMIPMNCLPSGGTVCDVGSGAGFPGLVFAVMAPDLRVTLLEPLHKRCVFLQAVIAELGLTNVTVDNRRAEDSADLRGQFDVTTARAVANLPVLSELCLPLTKTGGIFLAMKGPQAEAELQAAAHALTVLGGETENVQKETLPGGETRTNIIIRKNKATPAKYPRPYAKIKKNPL